MVSQDVPENADENALIICFCIAAVFVVMRTAARWYKLRSVPLEMEDLLIYGALASFAIMMSLYLTVLPILFRQLAVGAGLAKPGPDFEKDSRLTLRLFFTVQFFFWLTLWMVKWCLMFTFKKLTERLPTYAKIWWGTFIFSIVIFIGLCITNITSCRSFHSWFTPGECNSPEESKAKNISLFIGLGGDLLTDLLIMLIPVCVLWTVQISFMEKLGLAFVFTVGIITMITGIIRSVTLESRIVGGQVQTSWLILWGGIENVISIVVGCLPPFAIFVRVRMATSKASDQPDGSHPPTIGSKPKSGKRTLGGSRQDGSHAWGSLDTGSDKSLVMQDGDIVVTHTWGQSFDDAKKGGGGGGARKKELGAEYELEIVGGGHHNHQK